MRPAVLRRAASVPGPASFTFKRTLALSAMRRSCEAVGSPTRARNTGWARVNSSAEGRRRRSRSSAAAARSASGRHRRARPQRDPAAPAGGGRLQFGSIVAHSFDTNGWNRRSGVNDEADRERPRFPPFADSQSVTSMGRDVPSEPAFAGGHARRGRYVFVGSAARQGGVVQALHAGRIAGALRAHRAELGHRQQRDRAQPPP